MIYTSDFILQNIEKIQLVDCPVLVIHVSVFSHYIIDSCFIYYIKYHNNKKVMSYACYAGNR